VWKWAAIGALVLLVAIQFVPYGRDHANPAGGQPIVWDSARTERLMTGACMDCHSNETRWPWYSNVAPVSWLVQRDVEDGRHALNLSTGEADVREMIEKVDEGEMPPWQYKPAHPAARLSSLEKRDLVRGIVATFGSTAQRP
jgi:mono/diheme cytochrome c family protein